ncbi:hypothetical protein PUN28_010007 [Cardiocondyla obscurior]|uniref:Ycf15 n=1 Tax=Cardiocondyla obscurior TaxID=286306 RepID=A0AAW2FSB8_9HYME
MYSQIFELSQSGNLPFHVIRRNAFYLN